MLSTATSLLLRADQAYSELLCEKHTLDWGIAFSNPSWGDLPEGAQFREVLVQDSAQLSEAFEQAESHFFDRGMVCRRWTPAIDQSAEMLAEFLEHRGYRRREMAVMALPGYPELFPANEFRVLPGRPMRKAYRQTFLAQADDGRAELRADAAIERLNDAGVDMFVAMADDRPVGRGGMFQVGDIGRIVELYVTPDARRRGVGKALLHRILGVARRSSVRTVCTSVDASDAGAVGFLESCGFRLDAHMPEFDLAVS